MSCAEGMWWVNMGTRVGVCGIQTCIVCTSDAIEYVR